ncbi:MAG: peptidyl-prolyl cis-trans isomerase SurA [Aliidongia sp.]|nr:peptidyl-prolyl cis-trans isomerase SurA [Aliidongia sp.]
MLLFRLPGVVIALSLLALATVPAARAQNVRIIAVVNDEVISAADLNARVSLTLLSSSFGDDPATRQRVAAQVLRQMIDEKLEIAESKKHDVKVSDEDVDNAYRALENQNKMQPGGLEKYLGEHGIPKSALINQLYAQIIWARSVRGRYGHSIGIGDDEVNDAIKQMEDSRDKMQNRVGEIFLSVNDPSQDTEVRDFANRLVSELQRGAQFPQVARQFSQAAEAAQGGDIGWVLPGMLDPEVEQIINGMDKGQLTKPLRLGGGYYVFLLIDRRTPQEGAKDVIVNLTQVVVPLPDGADASARAAASERAAKLTAEAKSCGEMSKIGRDVSPDQSGPIGDVKIKELPEEIRPTILGAALATPTKPVPVRNGIGVFMVCKREGGEQVDRELVSDNLLRQRLDNLARRYLADLRLVAYIDLRV